MILDHFWWREGVLSYVDLDLNAQGIQTNAEKAVAEEPPVVKGGRFAGFLFGEED